MKYEFLNHKSNFFARILLSVIIVVIIIILAHVFFPSQLLSLNPVLSGIIFILFGYIVSWAFLNSGYLAKKILVKIETKETEISVIEGGKRAETISYKNIFGIHTQEYPINPLHSLSINHFTNDADVNSLDSERNKGIKFFLGLSLWIMRKVKFRTYIMEKDMALKIEGDISARMNSLNKPVMVPLDPGFSNLAVDTMDKSVISSQKVDLKKTSRKSKRD